MIAWPVIVSKGSLSYLRSPGLSRFPARYKRCSTCLILHQNIWWFKAFCRSGCDLANVYLVIDEYTDAAEPQAAARICDIVMDVLNNPCKERKSDDKIGIFIQEWVLAWSMIITQLRWFHSFWKRALALTTPEDTCVNRFINGFDMYMKSMIKEAEDRENKRVRTVDDYLQLRRETFATQASISFLSFGLELPEEVLLHPVMKTVTLASMDILYIINVSFRFDRTYKLTDVFIF